MIFVCFDGKFLSKKSNSLIGMALFRLSISSLSFVSCLSRNVHILYKLQNLQHLCVMLLISVWSVERFLLSFLISVIMSFFFFVSLEFIKFIVLIKELAFVLEGWIL